MAKKIRTLTRRDVARQVAGLRSIPIRDADDIVECVLSSIRTMLMTADPEVRLEVRDFGVFEVKLAKAKPRARNPKTGQKVYVPPRRKTHFKPSKLLKIFLVKPLSPEVSAEIQGRNQMQPQHEEMLAY